MPTVSDRSEPVLPAGVLRILRCPTTGRPLTQRGDELVVTGDETIRYPITGGVPRLLPYSADPEGHS